MCTLSRVSRRERKDKLVELSLERKGLYCEACIERCVLRVSLRKGHFE